MIGWLIIQTGGIFIDVVRTQLTESGEVNLTVFVCPSYTPQALLSTNSEEYVCDTVNDPDLFTPRIPKIKSIVDELSLLGVGTNVMILVGDTDPQCYVLPMLECFGVDVDSSKYVARLQRYAQSFADRAEKLFGKCATVISLTDLGVELDTSAQYTDEQVFLEIEFFKWLFSVDGPYKGRFSLGDDNLYEMAKKKFELYAAQGWIVSSLCGGLVLQTERPWLLRTQMLQSSGAPLRAIYPWIRKEEL